MIDSSTGQSMSVVDSRWRPRARAFSVTCGVIAALWTIFVVTSGGFAVQIHGKEVLDSHRAVIPAVVALACLLAAIAIDRHGWIGDLSVLPRRVDRAAPWLAGTLALVALGIGLEYGTFVAGGSDSYGYVSQAELWMRGRLTIEEPLAKRAPWPYADMTFAPLGYRPAQRPGAIVPTYAPGLPLTMAAAAAIGGRTATFVVVPVLGAWLVWLTYRLGRVLATPTVGLLGAALLVASPVFVQQVTQPMSDVPVAAWWVASLLLASRGTTRSGMASGLVGAMAILTRPNLAPLVVAPLCTLLMSRGSVPRGAASRFAVLTAFSLGVAPGIAAVALLNNTWYGSPFRSGYGSLAELYSWSNVLVNAGRYSTWTYAAFSALPLAALFGPFSLGAPVGSGTPRRGLLYGGLTLVLLLIASYLPYAVFEGWSYLRFFLPGLPIVLVLAAATVVRLSTLLPRPVRALAVWLLCAGLAGRYVQFADREGVFTFKRQEARYERAGALARQVVPPDGVLLAVQHSGAGRLYGERLTIRWDWIERRGLDEALAWLNAQGRPPYILLEDSEEPEFRRRFAEMSVIGALDWPAAAEVVGYGFVRLYDPADRARYVAGGRIKTLQLLGR